MTPPNSQPSTQPAGNFLLLATDFLFDRWQHYLVPIVTEN